MSTIIDRIRDIMQHYNLTERAFAIKINMSPQSLNNQMNGKNAINASLIVETVSNFRDIDANWLILGEGNMFKHQDTTYSEQSRIPQGSLIIEDMTGTPGSDNTMNQVLSLIRAKDAQIERILKLMEQK